jgi:uroporphyrin-III C-methyltransferase
VPPPLPSAIRSRKLTFVTAHTRAGESLALDWTALADPDATTAIYMGKASAAEVAAQMIAAGLPGATPALMVESASLPGERIVRTRLDLLGLTVNAAAGARRWGLAAIEPPGRSLAMSE